LTWTGAYRIYFGKDGETGRILLARKHEEAAKAWRFAVAHKA